MTALVFLAFMLLATRAIRLHRGQDTNLSKEDAFWQALASTALLFTIASGLQIIVDNIFPSTACNLAP